MEPTELALLARVAKLEKSLAELDTAGRADQLNGIERLDRLEEEVAISPSGSSQNLLRRRVKRLEEAVGEIHEANATMEESLRVFALANLKIKRALGEVIKDLASLSGYGSGMLSAGQ